VVGHGVRVAGVARVHREREQWWNGHRRVTAAGLVETYVDADGQQAMRLTADGERVARQLAMLGADEQDVLMAALLEDAAG
jgi:hypothetical protein